MKRIELVKIISPTMSEKDILNFSCPQDFNCKGDCENQVFTGERCIQCWNTVIEEE